MRPKGVHAEPARLVAYDSGLVTATGAELLAVASPLGWLAASSVVLPGGVAADDDFLLSVMYQPEPLKTMPTG